MNLDEIKKIAHMARIRLSDEELPKYQDINDILEMVAQISEIDTSNIEPMAHPIEMSQRLREDIVTETNQRDQLQKFAPNNVEAGIYLVPQVVDQLSKGGSNAS